MGGDGAPRIVAIILPTVKLAAVTAVPANYRKAMSSRETSIGDLFPPFNATLSTKSSPAQLVRLVIPES